MLRFLRTILAGLAIFAALAASPAAAKMVNADINQIMKLLQSKGHKVEIKTYDKETYLRIKDDDFYGYNIYFYGCDEKGAKCTSVQFYSTFEPAKSPSLDDLNSYTRQHRFGRVYLDKEGYPSMEWDVNLAAGGMREEMFLDNVLLWEAMVEMYGDFLFGKDGENNKPKT